GIDLSGAAIESARQQSFARAQFVVGDVMTADLGRSAFDVVVLNEVLYYAPDATAFLERIRALLNEDGSVVISMWRHPGDRTLWKAVDTVFRVVDRVEIRNRANSVNPRGWIVACCRARN
ncbi:MAG TPA: class I SAM-dependent methyltransferase, partial [Acidimicrobiia bacterium]|nr:class I SAM-dependent methyltransferase [Acidimicrobiia bacterium]